MSDYSWIRERLDLFIFFHLGSDAEVAIQETEVALRVSLSHPRVHPFSFEIQSSSLQGYQQEPLLFEDFLLDQLTQHRRGRPEGLTGMSKD